MSNLISLTAASAGFFGGGRKWIRPAWAVFLSVLTCGFVSASETRGSEMSGSETVRLALDHDRLTAGDLASVLPGWGAVEPAEMIAYAPLPGIERRVGASRLIGWGRRFGVDLTRDEMPETLLISRRMRTVGPAEAEERLREAVASYYGVVSGAVEVALVGFEDLRVPAGELTFEAAGSFQRLNRPSSVVLRWREDGGRGGTLWLRATISIVGRYAVAREKLDAKVPLSPEDFEFREGPLPGNPEKFLISREAVDGMSLRYSLNRGDALTTDLLVKHRAVRRGDLIELQLRSGLIMLRVPGRAEEAAAVGDVIACRNLESGSRVSARVLDSKHAEVEWLR